MTHESATPQRRSVRLKDYDYSQSGGYFITICTRDWKSLFGEIVDGALRLNSYGEIVRDEWLRSAEISQKIDLDAFVVMPNHFHGIAIIKDKETNTVGRPDQSPVQLGQCPDSIGATHRVAPTTNAPKRHCGPTPGSIGVIVGQFKSIATKRINAIRGARGVTVWQRNYYEHVIRNEKDLDKIRIYIVNNPLRWAEDENNPQHL